MHIKIRLLIQLASVCALFLTSGSFYALADQALSDEDCCVKKNMQREENTLETAESKIIGNKRSLENTIDSVVLPDESIERLAINAGFGWGIFSGSIYNGNRQYLVTQLTVSMTPIHDHHMEMSSHVTREYKIDLNLPPFSKGALSVPIANDDVHVHDFEWKIIQVLGYKLTDMSDPE